MIILFFVAVLTGCGETPIDETIMTGSWVVAGDTCSGSGEKLLRYQDGNLVGNNLGGYEPFFKIHSAQYRGREIWIEFEVVMARARSAPVGIVFVESGGKLLGQRTFDGKDFSKRKEMVDGLTWTRCSKSSSS